MQEPLKYNHVNWVDGMKINKNHFIGLENATRDQVKDALGCGLNDKNYGLLPSAGEPDGSLQIVMTLDNQKTLRVKIFKCNAITPGGARIEISEGGEQPGFAVPFPEATFGFSEQGGEATVYVALSVDPFARVPLGNADPAEEPPRYPFVNQSYKVHIIPEEQLSAKEIGPCFLLIGKIRISDNKPELVREYIPPCTTLRGAQVLVRIHADTDRFFGQLELDLLKILNKISEKEQTNVLARVVAHLSENMLYFLSTGILEFRWKIIDQPPLCMFEFIARLARVIKNTIDSNSGESKEELLNYFTDWCNLRQGDFEKTLLNAINFSYDHSNSYNTVVVMMKFTDVIATLFNKLSILEYIGKKKDTNIFVKEQTGKKSFLAD